MSIPQINEPFTLPLLFPFVPQVGSFPTVLKFHKTINLSWRISGNFERSGTYFFYHIFLGREIGYLILNLCLCISNVNTGQMSPKTFVR